MKKLFLLFFFITGLAAVANAQVEPKTPEERAAHVTKSLEKTLNLTSDQASQVNSIFLTRAIRMDSLKNNPSADKRDEHLTKKGIKLATDQQMMSILNPDQQKQYMDWERMMEEKEQDKKAGMPAAAQGQ